MKVIKLMAIKLILKLKGEKITYFRIKGGCKDGKN